MISEERLLSGLPPARKVASSDVALAVQQSGRRIVVLDDDPTGTQTVAGVPVLGRWSEHDVRWAFQQPSPAFYILTNSRSLAPQEMSALNREVIAVVSAVAKSEGVEFVVASRGDSTLRGHYPAETDVIAEALCADAGRGTDGLVIVPAYVDAGRLTVDSVHWMRTPAGLVRVGESEFARDATFGYRSSDLRDYVVEKTAGRWSRDDVATITINDIRVGGVHRVAAILCGLASGRPVVVDAVVDDDLRLVSLAILQAEAAGAALLYRVGPSFVRARAGFEVQPPLTREELGSLGLRAGDDRGHGLVVVGSHVPRTTSQLGHLLELDGVVRVELDVAALLDPQDSENTVARTAGAVSDALVSADVALCTSRELVTGDDAHRNLEIARTASAGMVDVVRAVVNRVTPSWVVGKGGITSSDTATKALGISRAWMRGTMLPGIVSLWKPVTGTNADSPFIVFAGNVGEDAALADVVSRLRGEW